MRKRLCGSIKSARRHVRKREHTHLRNWVFIYVCKQTQTHADSSACAYICAHVRTFDRTCIYTHSIRANERSNDAYVYIVHPESFRSNAQITMAFARRNRPFVYHNDGFACVYLRSRAFEFAFVCEYGLRSIACAVVIDCVCVRTCAT